MKNLKSFLKPIQLNPQEIVISNRFLDEEGNPVKFIVKPLLQEENDLLQRRFMKKTKNGLDFDQNGFLNALVAESVIYPELDNAELQKTYGVMKKEDLLKKMLLVGEYMKLSEAVQEINLMNEEDQLIEEAKN